MAANRKAKVVYLRSPWSDFNNLSVYSRVFKMIIRQGHGQKVILKVKFKENDRSEGFPLSHIRLNGFVANCAPL